MISDPARPVKAQPAAAPTALSLDTPVKYLKGIGPRRCDLFKRLGIATLRDLLYHFPKRHEDRRTFLSIAQAVSGQKVTVRGRIMSAVFFRAKTGTLILQVVVRDASETALHALWFNQPYMRKWFPMGSEIILYGTAERIGKKVQMAVPEFERVPKEKAGSAVRSIHMGRVVPIYPATSGLYQRDLRTAVAMALKGLLPVLVDPLPAALRERHSLLEFREGMKRIHFPPAPEAVAAAQDRAAFDEFLCFHLALGIRRRRLAGRPGIAHQPEGGLVERWRAQLPFKLTAGQERAIAEIARDMAAPAPMRRLLQGEVGSGKTVVACCAIVVAAQGGYQAAVLAPTEVLARQHALTLSQFLAPAGIPVALLTSSVEEAERKKILQDLASGDAPVVVGTHALLETGVGFARLGLVVIDEQQKFGVDQREAIQRKGSHPDVLVLTATPIPRTLALTLYGEMEVSTILERPAGRQPVRTLWMDSSRKEEVYAFVKSELEAGRQAYVVCPRIGKRQAEAVEFQEELFAPEKEPAPPLSIAAATEIFKEYEKIFQGFRVGLLHGRMKTEEQKEVFASFKKKVIQVLVATQVIEVGVDVPNATVMVIEGAERFGLSQLHQLRGRVGRGEHEGTCLLVADPKHPAGAERLQTLVACSDGFKIAEEDLRLRGPGELLGKRQAGVPDLKCLAWASQGPWLEETRKEADRLLSEDPGLAAPELALLKKEVALRFPDLTG